MIGNHITQTNDPLKKISIDEWIHSIQNPRTEIKSFIERLRTIRTIDENLYKEQKKQLPYTVCAIFHPPIRRKEHFASTSCFIIDVDHLHSHDIHTNRLKEKLKNDPSVAAIFSSPSNDGLKILFLLDKPCLDAALFSSFYKVFLQQFSQRYNLETVVDCRTSDVTRACFLSYDPSAYYNTHVDKVKIENFIHNLDFDDAKEDIKQAEMFISSIQNTPKHNDLSEDILLKIKQKLNPNYRPKPQKQYYLPPEIDQKMPSILQCLLDAGIKIESESPINFGKKIRITAGNYWSELNIFYGKKGFTLVITPKSGSHIELGELARKLLQQHLFNE